MPKGSIEAGSRSTNTLQDDWPADNRYTDEDAVTVQGTRDMMCERCHGQFDPAHGGICTSCGRTLCRWHLYGWTWWRRWRGTPTDCVECRQKA
jgi:hypothetical protein